MNKYKIMLVDDEPDILDLLDKALTIEGYCNITKIDNGLSAINTCKEINPDIIVLDVSRYYRGTSTKEKSEGSGLGLAIAKQIIELHGGNITVSSKRGKGTKFEISIPEQRK